MSTDSDRDTDTDIDDTATDRDRDTDTDTDTDTDIDGDTDTDCHGADTDTLLAACAVATCSGSHMNLLLVRALGSCLDIPCAEDAGRCAAGGGVLIWHQHLPTMRPGGGCGRVWHHALLAPASVRVRVRVRVHALFNPRMSTWHPTFGHAMLRHDHESAHQRQGSSGSPS